MDWASFNEQPDPIDILFSDFGVNTRRSCGTLRLK